MRRNFREDEEMLSLEECGLSAKGGRAPQLKPQAYWEAPSTIY